MIFALFLFIYKFVEYWPTKMEVREVQGTRYEKSIMSPY